MHQPRDHNNNLIIDTSLVFDEFQAVLTINNHLIVDVLEISFQMIPAHAAYSMNADLIFQG